jgi:hypothetical protein
LAVGSSNLSLVHSLIVWQLSPYVRTNQNHKQTYEFLIQACAFKHQKSRLSPLYPNDPPLMTFISSNLKNEQILFSVYWCWVVWSWFLHIFLRFYDSVVFVVLLSDFRIVTTARYLLCFCQILELLR